MIVKIKAYQIVGVEKMQDGGFKELADKTLYNTKTEAVKALKAKVNVFGEVNAIAKDYEIDPQIIMRHGKETEINKEEN